MFGRVRLRIAALYAALMGLTLALVAAGIVALAAGQAQRTGDLELRLRAEGVAADAARGRRPPSREDDHDDERDHDRRSLERRDLPAYLLPVVDGRLMPVANGGALPDWVAAGKALAAGEGRYTTVTVDGGTARVYSLPMRQGGQIVAVAQVARSQYFVEQTVTRLLLVVLGMGAAGLVVSAAAGYWLAGRTLRPIAAALQRQRDFAADASHEIRAPLALIRGAAEVLQRHPQEPIADYAEEVADIVEESDRLTRLVTRLLTLARADDGRAGLNLADVDLTDLVRTLVADFTPVAVAKGLRLDAAVEDGVRLVGDADRLREIGVALLDNALRYTTAGSVRVTLGADSRGATFSVSDTGPGIAPEHLPRVFERFFRTDPARSKEDGGAGLGLAIARWIAEAHGGSITAASVVGQGTAFTVRLPRAASIRGGRGAIEPAPHAPRRGNGAGA